MMSVVMSQREYAEKTNQLAEFQQKSAKRTELITPSEAEDKIKTTYYLFYPDNARDKYFNGTFKVNLDGTVKDYKIENGILKTTDKSVMQYCCNQGFALLYEKQENENA